MKLAEAKYIADMVVSKLFPYCDKILVAGSIRREKSEVKDIEIICQPKLDEIKDLFGKVITAFRSPEFVLQVRQLGSIIKGNPRDGRYVQIVLDSIMLDLFIPDTKDFWRQYAIRTGSSEYSHWVLALGWNRIGWVGTKDGLRRSDECTFKESDGKKIYICHKSNPTLPPVWESEEDFFKWINVPYLQPKDRNI